MTEGAFWRIVIKGKKKERILKSGDRFFIQLLHRH